MTEIRVNSVLPIVKADAVKSSRSDSNFLFSLQSVSAADVGSKISASEAGSSTDSPDRTSQIDLAEAVSRKSGGADSPNRASQTDTSKAASRASGGTDSPNRASQTDTSEAANRVSGGTHSPNRASQTDTSEAAGRESIGIGSLNPTLQTDTSAAEGYEITSDNGSDPSAVQSGQQNDIDLKKTAADTDPKILQNADAGSKVVYTENIILGQQITNVLELQGTVPENAEQTVTEVGNKVLEIRDQDVKTHEANPRSEALPKQPMLDLDRILERLGSFTEDTSQVQTVVSAETEDNGAEPQQSGRENPTDTAITAISEKEKVLHNNVKKAPVIDLDRILEDLKPYEEPQQTAQAEDIPLTAEPDNKKAAATEQTTLPQINFDRILESVKTVRNGDEVAPSAKGINAAEAEKDVKQGETSDSEKIAANVGVVWDNLTAVVNAAADSAGSVDDEEELHTEATSKVVSMIDNSKPYINRSRSRIKEHPLIKLTQELDNRKKPATLDELKDTLANAMKIAVFEINDPIRRQKEQEEKILEFLLKFLEKLNGDDEDDKENPLDGKKGGDLGILLQIIENMIDEVRDGNQIADSRENVFEIAPAAAVESVKNEYGVNTEASVEKFAYTNVEKFADTNVDKIADTNVEKFADTNVEKFADTNVDRSVKTNADKFTDTNRQRGRAAENKTELGRVGAAEGLYTSVADKNADKAVVKTQGADISEAYEKITVASVQSAAGITKIDPNEDDDDLDAKAAKVLSKPNRDGTIRHTELPDEFAELKKLIDDMKKTHEDEEEPEEDDDEKEVGVGGKGVRGDDKSEIIRAISIKSSEPGEAAVAKAFSMERSGAKQILSQIASEVLNNMPKEKRTVALVMTLTPENLGKVTLKITEQAGKLNVVVTAHNKETAEILASRMDGLQDALKDSGTQLEKYQVVYGPQQEADARQQSYEGSSKNPYVRDDDEEGTDKDGEFAELLQKAV